MSVAKHISSRNPKTILKECYLEVKEEDTETTESVN